MDDPEGGVRCKPGISKRDKGSRVWVLDRCFSPAVCVCKLKGAAGLCFSLQTRSGWVIVVNDLGNYVSRWPHMFH